MILFRPQISGTGALDVPILRKFVPKKSIVLIESPAKIARAFGARIQN